MRAGPLDKRVLLQRRVDVQSDTGAITPTWLDIREVWADIRHPSGMEAVRSGVPVSVVAASIRIRYRSDVDATCRAVYRGTAYGIKAVLPSQVSRDFLDLVCEGGENHG